MLALLLLVAACGGGTSATPEPSPTAVEPTPEATTAAASDVPTKPGPEPGVACPVAVAICQFAVDMETIVKTGDIDAFFADATMVTATCSGEATTPGTSPGLCEGAAANEVREGYWALQGGEALVVTESELRAAMARWFDSVARAGGTSDSYGPGEMRIGAISCTRRPEANSGDCIGNSIQVHFTFINPETVNGTGTPGQRITFHISAGVVDGVPRANGLGTVSPPNRTLTPSVINIQDGQGNPLLVEVYPWTH